MEVEYSELFLQEKTPKNNKRQINFENFIIRLVEAQKYIFFNDSILITIN